MIDCDIYYDRYHIKSAHVTFVTYSYLYIYIYIYITYIPPYVYIYIHMMVHPVSIYQVSYIICICIYNIYNIHHMYIYICGKMQLPRYKFSYFDIMCIYIYIYITMIVDVFSVFKSWRALSRWSSQRGGF